MGFGDERGDGGYRESFLSHYAADVTVPQQSEPEPCDHGSHWTDHDGRDHCLVCPHVSQPSEPHVHEFKLRYVCDCGEHSTGLAKGAEHG